MAGFTLTLESSALSDLLDFPPRVHGSTLKGDPREEPAGGTVAARADTADDGGSGRRIARFQPARVSARGAGRVVVISGMVVLLAFGGCGPTAVTNSDGSDSAALASEPENETTETPEFDDDLQEPSGEASPDEPVPTDFALVGVYRGFGKPIVQGLLKNAGEKLQIAGGPEGATREVTLREIRRINLEWDTHSEPRQNRVTVGTSTIKTTYAVTVGRPKKARFEFVDSEAPFTVSPASFPDLRLLVASDPEQPNLVEEKPIRFVKGEGDEFVSQIVIAADFAGISTMFWSSPDPAFVARFLAQRGDKRAVKILLAATDSGCSKTVWAAIHKLTGKPLSDAPAVLAWWNENFSAGSAAESLASVPALPSLALDQLRRQAENKDYDARERRRKAIDLLIVFAQLDPKHSGLIWEILCRQFPDDRVSEVLVRDKPTEAAHAVCEAFWRVPAKEAVPLVEYVGQLMDSTLVPFLVDAVRRSPSFDEGKPKLTCRQAAIAVLNRITDNVFETSNEVEQWWTSDGQKRFPARRVPIPKEFLEEQIGQLRREKVSKYKHNRDGWAEAAENLAAFGGRRRDSAVEVTEAVVEFLAGVCIEFTSPAVRRQLVSAARAAGGDEGLSEAQAAVCEAFWRIRHQGIRLRQKTWLVEEVAEWNDPKFVAFLVDAVRCAPEYNDMSQPQLEQRAAALVALNKVAGTLHESVEDVASWWEEEGREEFPRDPPPVPPEFIEGQFYSLGAIKSEYSSKFSWMWHEAAENLEVFLPRHPELFPKAAEKILHNLAKVERYYEWSKDGPEPETRLAAITRRRLYAVLSFAATKRHVPLIVGGLWFNDQRLQPPWDSGAELPCRLLAKLADPGAVKFLIPLLASMNPQRAQAARHTIQQLTGRDFATHEAARSWWVQQGRKELLTAELAPVPTIPKSVVDSLTNLSKMKTSNSQYKAETDRRRKQAKQQLEALSGYLAEKQP